MQFGSRIKRNTFLNFIVLLVPEIGLAAIIASYFEAGLLGFWIVLSALLLLYLILWIKNSLFAWAWFLLLGRRRVSSSVAEYFRNNRFPEPNDYEVSPDDYLLRTMSDDAQPINVRLDAAASLSEMNTLKNFGYFQASMRARLIYEDALEAYKISFRVAAS